MASEKQIAANRANAKRSTGPRSAIGKMNSSRNAYRHGLSCPLQFGRATSEKVEAISRLLVVPPSLGDRSITSVSSSDLQSVLIVLTTQGCDRLHRCGSSS